MGVNARVMSYRPTNGHRHPRTGMNRFPTAGDLTSAEYMSLLLVAPGFMSRTIPKAHQARLIELGLIQSAMGGLMATPMGHIVARIRVGR
jgi:hypothetical protein